MEPIEGDALLAKLVDLPVSTWRYEWEPEGVVHIGPMAQDFAAMFELGDNDKVIAVGDYLGVMLVALQALARKVSQLEGGSDG